MPGHLGAAAAASLITLAMAPFHLWPLALVAPTLLFILLQGLTPWQAALRGWFFGLGLFASGASWVYVSIQVHGNTPPLLAGVMTAAFVCGLALFFALHGWIWQRWITNRWWLLSWPALWVLMEAFRSWFLTGFPWLLLGTAHLESPFSGWAPILGVYGVSGLSALAGLLLLYAIHPGVASSQTAKKKTWLPLKKNQTLAFLGALAIAVSGIPLADIQWTRAKGEPLSAALIQGNIPQQDKWNPAKRQQIIQTYLDLSAQAGSVDLLIWPETALPLTSTQARPFLQEAVAKAGPEAALITGLVSRVPQQPEFYNSLVTAGKASGHYHKVKLVPFGEYLPLEGWLRGLIDFFDLPMSNFLPGPEHPAYLEVAGTRAAPLICYEAAYPDFSARQAASTHWLVTLSNDSWFGRSLGPLQHYQIARFRALETGRELARATNNGITAVADHRGRIKAELEQFSTGLLLAEIQPRQGQTPFMRFGSWPLLLVCLVFMAWLTRPGARRKAG